MSPDTVAQAPDHLPYPAESGEKESVTGLQDGAVKFDILLKKILIVLLRKIILKLCLKSVLWREHQKEKV